MQKDVFGLIYAGEENMNLRELVNERSVSALPIGGRYRVIDFVLSNMVNTGIRNIGVIPKLKYQSLMDHLGSGKEWDLSRKTDGLFILPPFDTVENGGMHKGTVDIVRGASSYIRRASQKYCLLCGSYTLYTGVYDKMFEQHMDTGADITILYNVEQEPSSDIKFKDLRLATDENGRVTDIQFKSANCAYNKVGMDMYLIKKDLLMYLLDDAASHGKYDLVQDVIIGNLDKLKVYGYEHKGYVGRLTSVASYYKINMDFLKPEVQKELFYTGYPVYTKVKDHAPTKYEADCKVKNSIIGSGCVIEGEVENCVIFRDIHVAKGTSLKNCIVMQDTEIMENASLEHVILDKKVTVKPNTRLIGNPAYPVIIPKGARI